MFASTERQLYFSNRIFCYKIPYVLEGKIAKNIFNLFKSQKDSTIAYKHERVLQVFYFRIFEYSQIWLNILMEDHHLSNIPIFFIKKHLGICVGAH
jgi:hypothetical protein